MPQTGTFHGENDDSSEKSKGYPKMAQNVSLNFENMGKYWETNDEQ
jgi:hypothetical protein